MTTSNHSPVANMSALYRESLGHRGARGFEPRWGVLLIFFGGGVCGWRPTEERTCRAASRPRCPSPIRAPSRRRTRSHCPRPPRAPAVPAAPELPGAPALAPPPPPFPCPPTPPAAPATPELPALPELARP